MYRPYVQERLRRIYMHTPSFLGDCVYIVYIDNDETRFDHNETIINFGSVDRPTI